MTKKNKRQVKDTNSEEKVPWKDVNKFMLHSNHIAVFGNEQARKVLIKKVFDQSFADDVADCVATPVYQDDGYREKFRKDMADNPVAMAIYDAAIQIRKILNLDALDEYQEKVRKFVDAENECKRFFNFMPEVVDKKIMKL